MIHHEKAYHNELLRPLRGRTECGCGGGGFPK
jgi:hypothetical protein